ncbi:RCC1 and BTB domain-containing protein 1-like isoform X1 [Tachypleus tridentatus]|uniref:RCC1 and BTB domain-containing protein 1-like isoform X1 n=1 Tax=Tachypleus tridentatus TaxID=6853 RepID=UPI003FD506ED
MTGIDKWLILSTLTPDLLLNVKLVCVFGSSGNEAIIITKDGEVYALGSNCSGCLGLGDSEGSLWPKKVDSLCKRGIKDLACGSGPHVLALTESGDLYSWGHNGYYQLGNGSTNQGLNPGLITTNLGGLKVIEIACGSHHSIALTSNGEVYAWGQNSYGQVGLGSTTNQPTPRKVTSGIGARQCIAIACGQSSSMAVLDNGEVYGWGYNGNGQLGLGINANQYIPCQVTNLQAVVIQKIACGYAHTLALSDEGVLYAWGANSCGQLGTGNKADQVTPVRIATEFGRIAEIAASHYNHTSAASTQTCEVYMWGQCRGQSVTAPEATSFHCLHDVFACFASPAVTSRPMELDVCMVNTVGDSLQQAFDDPSTSDLQISIEGKFVYVHKAILKIRCKYFRSMFQTHWREDVKETIEITQFSYPVYRAFLCYLYTDKVDISLEDAIGLLDLANSYCELRLKQYCEQIIKHNIHVDNVAVLYVAAIKYEAKNLEDFCLRFAVNHLTAVVQTDAFNKLDELTVKKVYPQSCSTRGL